MRQGIEAQLRSPLHSYHSRVRLVNYNCYFFEPITLEELDKVNEQGVGVVMPWVWQNECAVL